MSPDDLDLSELRTLSAQEVADAVGVPIETVWSAAKTGSLYGRKLGREWRFTIPAVKDWIGLAEERTSTSDRAEAAALDDATTPKVRKASRKRA
ncbi:MAG: helix-turn-helix domain-containing protein [Actinomycetota bacterium]